MTKTVKQQNEEIDQVKRLLDSGNALAVKLSKELQSARVVLEGLRDYQHPKMSIDVPYHMRAKDREKVMPASLIDMQVQRINELLGDRA